MQLLPVATPARCDKVSPPLPQVKSLKNAQASPSSPDFFWEPTRASAHVVQLYDTDRVFLDALEAWVAGGLLLGESVIVIATPAHRRQLTLRLRKRDLEPTSLQIADRLVLLDAEESLARLMRDGMPDPDLFNALLERLLERTPAPVRAFGEMVVLLWRAGQREATLELERLWSEACARHRLALLCAYPHAVFGHESEQAIRHVCAAHDSVVMT